MTRATQIFVNSSAALQQAINTASDGDVVEIAGGTYTAPPGGFTLYNRPKSFGVRAAQGATVTLTGNDTTDILRFANGNAADKRLITFENLTFSNGRTTEDAIGGGLTLVLVEAAFLGCVFQNNAGNAPNTGGGAQWINSSSISFQDCSWTNNTSPNFGAGISSLDSEVFLSNCRFTGNRVNVINHNPSAPGGAIFATDSTLWANNCRFENNGAGYVGGAIYLYGTWRNPESTPTSQLTVSNSLFTGNVASRDPSVPSGAPALGGAIHVEDQTTAKFFNCRFNDNVAREGGAISNYRAITEIEGCAFQGNQATGSSGAESIGGAIFAISSDLPDASTGNGTINRRSVQLDIRDSVFQGKADGSPDARQGGAIFVLGDENAAYGLNGVQQNGTVESNRAVITLTRVAFADYAVADAGGISGAGGAVAGYFATLNIDSSIFQNCIASGSGGALEALGGASVLMTNTTISGCKAGSLGGAIALFGGNLNITQSNFVQNQITGSHNGSVMISVPSVGSGGIPDEPVTGMIANCVFSNNSGGASIFEGDRNTPPFNLLQYSGNTIFSATGGAAYDNDRGNTSTVAQLNHLVIHRSGSPDTIKAPLPGNVAPASAPTVTALLMLPPTVLQSGAPGETLPIPSELAYASSGGTVALDGMPQASSSGIVPTSVNGVHTLAVGSTSLATVPPPGAALNISTRLPVGIGQNVLIGGFVIQGPISKNVMIRAIGPSLPLVDALQDPVLELHDGTGAIIATNDNWRSTQISGLLTSSQSVDIQASALAPLNDAESAIIATLSPGAYTAVVRGANNSTGIAVIEGYDLDSDQSSKLANISTRGFVQTGNDVMIGGFILGGGTGTTRVVVRGIGPSLGASGITNPLLDPMLELHDANGTIIDANDDWKTNQALIQSTGLQPTNDAESALLLTNPAPGAYTAILRGKNNGTGVGVVEAYVFQ